MKKPQSWLSAPKMCRQQRPCILSANLGEIKLVNCCVALSWCLDPKFWISTNNHKLNLFVAVSTLLLFLSLSSQITQSFLFLRVVVRNHFLFLLSVKHVSKIFFKSGPLTTNISIIQNGIPGLAIPLAQKTPSTERRALFGCQRRCHKKVYLTSSHWTWRALGKQKKETVKAGTWLWSYLQMFFWKYGEVVYRWCLFHEIIMRCEMYTFQHALQFYEQNIWPHDHLMLIFESSIRSMKGVHFAMIFGVPWVFPTAKVFLFAPKNAKIKYGKCSTCVRKYHRRKAKLTFPTKINPLIIYRMHVHFYDASWFTACSKVYVLHI